MKVLKYFKFNFIILSLFIILPLMSEAADRFVLHFDINNTLIATDSIKNKSTEDVINCLLAKKHVGIWDQTQLEPMSYYDYVNKVVVPGDSKDPEVKKVRLQYLVRFTDLLWEQNHLLYQEINEEYFTIYNKLSSAKSRIFNSFYKLLESLDDRGIQYSVVLRSFGSDLDDVASEINSALGKQFFTTKAFFKDGVLNTNFGVFNDSQSIYNFMISQGSFIIQDDWEWWNSHHETSEYGKPFYLQSQDKSVIQVFFDDNIKSDNDFENIIAPIDVKTNSPLKISEVIQAKQAVRVNTLEAILDDNYFIKHLEALIGSPKFKN